MFFILLTAAAGLQTILRVPYTLKLAAGSTAMILKSHILMLILIVPFMIYLVEYWGAIGGASAKVIMFILYALIMPVLIHKSVTGKYIAKWVTTDFTRPVVISMAVVLMFMFTGEATSDYFRIIKIALTMIFTGLLMLMFVPEVKRISLIALKDGMKYFRNRSV
jgi:hypothetical protein